MANLPFQFNSDILGEDLAARLEELTSQNDFAAAQSLIAETLNDLRSTPEADITEQDVQQFHTLAAIGSEIATINLIGLEAYQTFGELAQNGNWTDLQLLAADFLNNEDLSPEQSEIFANIYEQASYHIELAQFDTANSILASGDTEAMREFATERTEDPTLDATSFDSYGWNQVFLNTGFDPELAYTEDFYDFYETASMDAELDAMKARMDELVAANDFDGIKEMVASVYETANTNRDGQTAHYAQKFLQYTWEEHLGSVERRETSGELIKETEGESYLFGLIEGRGEYNEERQYLQTDMVRMMSDMEMARQFGHHSMDSQELVRRMMANSILENTSTDLAYNGNPTDITAGELDNNFYWLRESMMMALKGEDEILQQFNTGEITALMNGQIPETLANDDARRAALSAYGVDELSGVFSDTDPQRYLRSRALLQSASVDVTYEQPPEGSTEEELAENGNWLRSSVTLALAESHDIIDQFTDEEIQSLLEGNIAESLAGDTERLTELSQYGLNVMGQDMYNLVSKAQTAGVLTENGPVTQAMLAGRDLYNTLPNFTMSGTSRMAYGLLTDPTTYLGAGVFFKGVQGVKITGRTLLTQGAKVGALEGLVYGVADERLTQSVEIAGGRIEEADLQRLAIAGGAGMVLGGTLGRVIDGATVAVPKAYNRLMGRADNAIDAAPAPRVETAQPDAPRAPEVADATDSIVIPRSEIDPAPTAVNAPDAPDAPSLDTSPPRVLDAPNAAPDLRVITDAPAPPRAPEIDAAPVIGNPLGPVPGQRSPSGLPGFGRFEDRLAASPDNVEGIGRGTTAPTAAPSVMVEAPRRPNGWNTRYTDEQKFNYIADETNFESDVARAAFIDQKLSRIEQHSLLTRPELGDGTFARIIAPLQPDVQSRMINDFRAPDAQDTVRDLVRQVNDDIDAPRTAPPRVEEPAAPNPPPKAEEPAAEPAPTVETPEGAAYDLSRPQSIKPEHINEITEEYLESLTSAQISRMRPPTLRALHADGKLDGLDADALSAATQKMRAVNELDEATGTPPPRRTPDEEPAPRAEGEEPTPRAPKDGEAIDDSSIKVGNTVTELASLTANDFERIKPEDLHSLSSEQLDLINVSVWPNVREQNLLKFFNLANRNTIRDIIEKSNEAAQAEARVQGKPGQSFLSRRVDGVRDFFQTRREESDALAFTRKLEERNRQAAGKPETAHAGQVDSDKGVGTVSGGDSNQAIFGVTDPTWEQIYNRAQQNDVDMGRSMNNRYARGANAASKEGTRRDTLLYPMYRDALYANHIVKAMVKNEKMHPELDKIMNSNTGISSREGAARYIVAKRILENLAKAEDRGMPHEEVANVLIMGRISGLREAFTQLAPDIIDSGNRTPFNFTNKIWTNVIFPGIHRRGTSAWIEDDAVMAKMLRTDRIPRWLERPLGANPYRELGIRHFLGDMIGNRWQSDGSRSLLPGITGISKFWMLDVPSLMTFRTANMGWGPYGKIVLRTLGAGALAATYGATGLSVADSIDDTIVPQEYETTLDIISAPADLGLQMPLDYLGALSTLPTAPAAAIANYGFDQNWDYSLYFGEGAIDLRNYTDLETFTSEADPTRETGPTEEPDEDTPTIVGALDDGTTPPTPPTGGDNTDVVEGADNTTTTADATTTTTTADTTTTTTTPTDTTVATVTDAAGNAVSTAGNVVSNAFDTASAYSAEEVAEAALPGIGGNLLNNASQVQYGRWWDTLMNGFGWAGTAAGGIWNAMPQFFGPTGGAIAQGVTAIMAAMVGKNLVTGLWSRLTSAKGLGSMAMTGLFAVGAVHAFNYFSGRDQTQNITFTDSNYGAPATGLGRTTIQDLGPRVTPAGDVVGQVGGIHPSESEFAAANEILRPQQSPSLTRDANASFETAALSADERATPLLPDEIRVNGHMTITDQDGVPAVLASVETLNLDTGLPTQSWTNFSEIATEGGDQSADLGYVAAQNGMNAQNIAPMVASTYAAYGLDEDGQRRDAEFLPDALKGGNGQEIRFDMVAQLDSADTLGWASGTASSGALTPDTPKVEGPISFDNLIA